jgi:hypothetical protein
MSKKDSNREEILARQNALLKEALGLEAELALEEESQESDDMFAGLRKLTMPPKVDASFYVGHMPSPWPTRKE